MQSGTDPSDFCRDALFVMFQPMMVLLFPAGKAGAWICACGWMDFWS